MGHQSPPQYNPVDYVMDLVNQDMQIREQIKEAYLQKKIIQNVYSISSQLQSQYLIAESSEDEKDLTNPDNMQVNSLLDFYHK